MSTPPPIPKTQPRGRPPKIILEILYDYMESIEKMTEEREMPKSK
jgi:hypothetical protein